MFQSKIILFLFLSLLFITISCSQKVLKNKDNLPSVDNAPDNMGNISLNLEVKKVVLDNGLKILVLENHRLPIFTYYTFFDVGGRYEQKGLVGATHFLEHMMFKGAKKYGPGDFDKVIEGNGGMNNAYTSLDSTVYYESLPIAALPIIIDMEADRMVNLALESQSFESERNVILEERKSSYDNNPRSLLYLRMLEAVFHKTPYQHSVIGELEEIKALTREGIQNYFKGFYAPNNALIVVAGDVDTAAVIKMIKEKFGPIPPSAKLSELKGVSDDPQLYCTKANCNKREIHLHGSAPTPLFMLAYQGEKIGTRKGFVMDILASILGDGQSSYFYQQYVQNRHPKLNRIYVSNYTLKHSGIFYIAGELLKGVNFNQFKNQLLSGVKTLCDDAITDRNIQKTKNQYMVNYYKEIETNSGVAQFLGLRENFFGDYNFYKQELAIYNSIVTEEVKKACYQVFATEEYVLGSIWAGNPKKK